VYFRSQEPTNEVPLEDIELALESDVKALAGELQEWIQSEFTPPNREGLRLQTQFLPEAETGSNPTWFIGDLHGDLVALKVLTDYARQQDKRDGFTNPTKLFFLGDFVDGVPYSAEVIAWIMREWNDRPKLEQTGAEAISAPQFQLQAVIGNHDEGLKCLDDDNGGNFTSSISPSTFAEELNRRRGQGPDNAWERFGRSAIEFFKGLPRMVMLGKSIMVVHGGVPHSDVEIRTKDDLNSEQALSDFTWNRIHETAPRKIPNRVSRGSELGFNDLSRFMMKLEAMDEIGFAPMALIRGHDHHERNFLRYENYKPCAVLTLNAFTVNRGYFGQRYRDLSLLRWLPSDRDRAALYRLKFDDGELERIWDGLAPADSMSDGQLQKP
jgi:hypothetical protein